MLPWRGDAHSPDRPPLPLPPGPMPVWRGRRPLKRWRYVAAFSPEAMVCVGSVWIGRLPQAWWAVWDRREGALRERTIFSRPGSVVQLPPGGAVRVRDGDLEIDLLVDEAGAVESVCPHGRQYIWTRKQAGVPVRGTIRLGGDVLEMDALGVVDETAGYHARETAWRWSAGVGRTETGAVVGWNLVDGVNDPPLRSERSVWVDGVSREVGPVEFREGLGAVRFAEGGELTFSAEATRERHDAFGLLASDYVQPFGTFSGSLPGGTRITDGFGVMERHTARW